MVTLRCPHGHTLLPPHLLQGELMAPAALVAKPVLSPLTLGLLQDSGWYNVRWVRVWGGVGGGGELFFISVFPRKHFLFHCTALVMIMMTCLNTPLQPPRAPPPL